MCYRSSRWPSQISSTRPNSSISPKNGGKHETLAKIWRHCRALPLGVNFDKIVSSFMLVILTHDDQKQVVRSLASLLSQRGALVFLSSRDDFSPEWLTKKEWNSICIQAGLENVLIYDIFEYYRIVVAQKIPKEGSKEELPLSTCVASS